jgi:hypothetical protein
MLQRFVAASAVAGVLIACGAVVLSSVVRVYPLHDPALLTVLWCMVPVVWGVWAVLIPSKLMPTQLPEWGAVLGFILSAFGGFILNVPMKVTDVYLRMRWRGLGVLVAIAVYYLLWMVVRAVYTRLTTPAGERTFKAAA